MLINLRDFYPFYTCDAFIDVSDEIGAVLLESKRQEKNYLARLSYHKAYYSLDLDDGIESAVIHQTPTPEEVCLCKSELSQLYTAFAQLPDKQAKRLYAFFYLGMSKTEIARADGVSVNSVCESIVGGLEAIRKNFEKV
ncbi:MAG: sigma-70 family RNA polymerase sigma factor [Clostridiaceae bacterium]|nr:sigma-70 family RNA polymerase sigma factor [Clostridiaceae bacterium]